MVVAVAAEAADVTQCPKLLRVITTPVESTAEIIRPRRRIKIMEKASPTFVVVVVVDVTVVVVIIIEVVVNIIDIIDVTVIGSLKT